MGVRFGSSTRRRELAGSESAAHRRWKPARLLASASLSVTLVGASVLVTLVIVAALPVAALADVLREGGVVENATVVLYGLAVAAIWLVRNPRFNGASAAAGTVVLACCVAREISLRRWIIAAGDDAFCCAREVSGWAAVILVLALVVASVWLLHQHAVELWRGLLRHRPVVATLFAVFCVIALSQLFDRLPAILPGHALPPTAALLALAMEEILELLIPVLVIVAALQSRVGAHLATAGISEGVRDGSKQGRQRRA